MAPKVVVVKEEGTQPPSEGVLSRFGQVFSLSSLADMNVQELWDADVVLLDLAMPNLDATKILQGLRQRSRRPLIMCFDSSEPPRSVLAKLNRLAAFRSSSRYPRSGDIRHVARVLEVSQEGLSRILNVSARTAHRWLRKGAKPRAKVELDKLARLVSLLEQTFPDKKSIRDYLHHPNPTLDGEKPINLLFRGEFERVADDLEAIQEGVYI